jgi:hypothetical protein
MTKVPAIMQQMSIMVSEFMGFLSEGNQTFSDQLFRDTLVRPLEIVDHARVAQRLKQGHDLLVVQFSVLKRDDVVGEVHARSIPGTPALVKG